jgi:endonuclease-3
MESKIRAKKILQKLKKLFPNAGMVLRYKNNWELLVAVELSAQCTDVQVNKVTEKLFKKYPKFSDYVKANKKEFEQDIFATGFYRNKTKNILAAAKYLEEFHKGKIPRTMEEMIKIPGVGRKTANVVLGNAYGIVEGIAVDTHVKRLARVLGLSKENTPEKIEQDLMELFPKKEWFRLTYLLIEYGRKYCPARKHYHEKCPLSGVKPMSVIFIIFSLLLRIVSIFISHNLTFHIISSSFFK